MCVCIIKIYHTRKIYHKYNIEIKSMINDNSFHLFDYYYNDNIIYILIRREEEKLFLIRFLFFSGYDNNKTNKKNNKQIAQNK